MDEFLVKYDIRGYHVFLNTTGDYMFTTDTEKKAEAIVSALEKQLPYELEDISTVYTGEKTGTCKCGYESVMEHQKHCIECGQIVDWD